MIPFNKFTFKAQEALQKAQEKAILLHHSELRAIHLLYGLLNTPENLSLDILRKLNVNIDALEKVVNDDLAKLPRIFTVSPSQIYLSNETVQILDEAKNFSQKFSDEFVSCEHIFLALLSVRTMARYILERYGVNLDKALKILKELRGDQKIVDESPETKFRTIEKYTQNLTDLAKQRKLDPIIGRDAEIRRVIEILSRRTKNNPILIGEPGVGKTAIVEGLAQRIVSGDVPNSLKNKEIISLDISLMIAGTKFRGEFEERLKAFLKEVLSNKNRYIVFIDEIHTLVGAGAAEGAIDASNILKPSLTKGEFQVIGATTYHDYKIYIEKDPAFERRFQPVYVEEPSVDEAIAILRGLKEKYEVYHGVKISDSAVIAAVNLSVRYITQRFLPDKAIDLIDEAAAALKLERESTPTEIDNLQRKLKMLEIQKEVISKEEGRQQELKKIEREIKKIKKDLDKMIKIFNEEKEVVAKISELKMHIENLKEDAREAERNSDFGRVAEILYGELPYYQKKLEELEKFLENKKMKFLKDQVTDEDVAKVVSRWTGIPVAKLMESEAQRLARAEIELKKRVVGQDEAIEAVANALRRARAGLADEDRPLASFLFLGPTGVGKTELARALTEFMFNDEKVMIRLDMSEYMEPHSVAKLIGSPPGYVGYEEGGQLTEIIKHRPYSLILFDEIEKAHPDVFNILLQVLDNGRLTDAKGRTVNFKNTIIIMTSNLGSQYLTKSSTLGFSYEEERKEFSFQEYKDKVLSSIKEFFRPEFLNRIDEIIVFKPLTKEDLSKIVDIQIEKLAKRLKEKNNIEIKIDEKTKEILIKKGFSPEYGARPLKRIIQKLIVDPLAQRLINKEIKPGMPLLLKGEKDKILILPAKNDRKS